MVSEEEYNKLHREVTNLNKRKFKESQLKREIRSLKQQNAMLLELLNEAKTNNKEVSELQQYRLITIQYP